MIAVHKRICYDDEGRLECVCRWAATDVMAARAAGWARYIPRTLFICTAGHKTLSDRPVERCMRSVNWQPCLEPVTEVPDAAG